jgi:hypothetical protein
VGRVAISYWDYHDIPRVFTTRWHEKVLLFDCSFDAVRDDYEDYFAVYELPPLLAEHLSDRPWTNLASEGRPIGRVDVKDVKFPFKPRARTVRVSPTTIPEHGAGPPVAFLTGWIEDEVFERLGLD